jgi:hypothetical protein
VRRRDPFEDLVIADAFDRTTVEQAAWLRSDANLERFHAVLRALVTRLDGQLAADRARARAGGDTDRDWRRRTIALRHQLIVRLREITPAVKAHRRAKYRGDHR